MVMRSLLSNYYIQLLLVFLGVYICVVIVKKSGNKIDSDPLFLPLRHSEHPNVFLNKELFQPQFCNRSLFFVGQQKVGTQTVLKLINAIQTRHRNAYPPGDNVRKFRRDGECTCKETGFLEISDDMPWCSRCTPPFFTMFRDPLERVYSAYNYCVKIQGFDPLCAYKESITDICVFAKMWGNYQFDKFLTVPYKVSPRKVHTYAKKWCPDCTIFRRNEHRTEPEFEGQMYRSLVYTNKRMLAHYGLNDISTVQGKLHLQRVIESVNTSFAAIGLLERWNDTLRVFYAYTGCREFLAAEQLHANSAQEVKKGKGYRDHKKSIQELKSQGRAQASAFPVYNQRDIRKRWQQCLPNITNDYMAADIQIYKAAKEVFELQMKNLDKIMIS